MDRRKAVWRPLARTGTGAIPNVIEGKVHEEPLDLKMKTITCEAIDGRRCLKGCQSLTNSGNIDPDTPSLGGKNDIHPPRFFLFFFPDADQSIPAE